MTSTAQATDIDKEGTETGAEAGAEEEKVADPVNSDGPGEATDLHQALMAAEDAESGRTENVAEQQSELVDRSPGDEKIGPGADNASVIPIPLTDAPPPPNVSPSSSAPP